MENLNGKVAIISGGAGGIGSAIARNLIEAGVRVAIADLDLERAQRVVQSLGEDNAIAVRLDVTKAESWTAAREQIKKSLGPCDIVISNAGVGYTGTIDTISAEAWRWVYEVNVMGSLHAMHAFLPDMKARGAEGHIVLMCSITALHPFAQQAAYTTSKAALLNFATVLKSELQGTAIGVSAVCPGIVDTELRDNAAEARPAALKTTEEAIPAVTTRKGMAPNFIGKAVVEGIRANRFFVFTHADYATSVASDRDLMLAAMSISADPDYREPEAFLTPLPR